MENDSSNEKKFDLDTMRASLEQMAISAYIDLMTNDKVDPSIRKSSADSVMKALGKDAPPKGPDSKAPPVGLVLQFGSQLSDSLKGIALLTQSPSTSVLTGGAGAHEDSES